MDRAQASPETRGVSRNRTAETQYDGLTMSSSKMYSDFDPTAADSSEAVTNNVRVEVESRYSPEHSHLFQDRWLFQYTIRITNEGGETVQLLSRHWIITDAADRTEEVKGPGVVGKQPVLEPGESFEYSSWCPLKTSTGVMRGSYRMVSEHGHQFDIEIAPFSLKARYTVH
jgi:ApaG protein